MRRSKIDIQNASDQPDRFDVLVDGDHYARAATKEEAWMFVALAAREVVLIRDLTHVPREVNRRVP